MILIEAVATVVYIDENLGIRVLQSRQAIKF